MQLTQAITAHRAYLKSFAKETSQQAYEYLYTMLLKQFADREIESVTSEELFNFLNSLTEGKAQATKRLRFQQTKALFNHVINNLGVTMKHPCLSPMLKQTFRAPKRLQRQLPERETIDEILYKTESDRDRVALEIMSKGALRVGELLKLKPNNVVGSKLILESPKSGKQFETAFIPDKVATRLHQYIQDHKIGPDDRIFPISYSGMRSMMNRINQQFKTKIRLHDLRRFAATYASRNGVPLEIISKALLRHSSCAITELYLGKLDDKQTMHFVNTLYEK